VYVQEAAENWATGNSLFENAKFPQQSKNSRKFPLAKILDSTHTSTHKHSKLRHLLEAVTTIWSWVIIDICSVMFWCRYLKG